jgi:peptidoglycan biosynthesis protein MviN/MurJ (putative lipid II flippase)
LLNKIGGSNAHILVGLVVVTAYLCVSKLVGAFREVVVAARFGVNADIDSFAFLQNLVAWPAGVWTSVAVAVLVPALVKAESSDEAAAERFRQEVVGMTLLFGGTLAAVSTCVIIFGTGHGWFPLSRVIRAKVLQQVVFFGACMPLTLLYGGLAAFLMADRKYINSLLDGVPPLTVLLLFVGAGLADNIGLLLWATLIGTALQILAAALFQPNGLRSVLPRMSVRSPLWPGVLRSAGIVAAAQVVFSATVVADQFAAAGISDQANASLGYATRLTALLTTLGAIAISRVTLPVFSRDGADGARATGTAYLWASLLFAAGAGVAALGYFLSPFIVRLIFEHGEFNARDAISVTRIFQYGLLQMPFYFAGIVISQILAAWKTYWTFLIVGIADMAVKIAGLIFLVPRFGVAGITLSTALMYLFSMLLLLGLSFLVSRRAITPHAKVIASEHETT